MIEEALSSIENSALNDIYRLVFSIAVIALTAALVSLISQAVFGRLVRRLVNKQKDTTKAEKQKRADTLVAVFSTALQVVIWVTAIIFILSRLEVNLAALMTGAGVFGVIIGFGAQNTIKDILAGVFIIAENQYRVGDVVSLYASGREVAGVVEKITIRITQLRDLDGNVHIVRNGTADVVSNLTFQFANVNIDIAVDYSSDIDQVERIINQTGQELANDPEFREHIYEPIQFLRLDDFEDNGVRIKALGKVEAAKQWEVSGQFRRRIKKAFEKEGISIPLPQIVVTQK